MKRFQLLTTISLVACILLTSCSGQQAASTVESSSGTASKTTASKTNQFGWVIPDETIKITAFFADGDDAPSEATKTGRENMKKYILDNFNVDLTMQTTSGDGTEAINLALASGTYPDLIYDADYDTVLKFKKQNKAQELTKYMDTIGKDIKEKCGDIYPLLLDDDGKLWSIPIGVDETMTMPVKAANIRYDEYLEIGSPEINTPEDYYNALKQILALHPKTANGEKRYALSLYKDQNYVKAFTGFWGFKFGWNIADDGSFTYWTNTDAGKSMTKWFNQIYRDGLFDPDAFNNTYDEWKSKFSNEKIAGSLGDIWMVEDAGNQVWQSEENVSENKRCIQLSMKASGVDEAYLSGITRTGGAYTIVTDKATDVENIMKFIDFQATDSGLALFYWGIPNGEVKSSDSGESITEWNIDEDGNWAFDEDAEKQFVTGTWNGDDQSLTGASTFNFFSTFNYWGDNSTYHVWPSYMWQDQNKWKTMEINNMKGTIYDVSAMNISDKDDETKLTEQAIQDAWSQYWPAVVQSKNDAEFETNWSALQKAVEDAGIEKYTKTMEANYKKHMA